MSDDTDDSEVYSEMTNARRGHGKSIFSGLEGRESFAAAHPGLGGLETRQEPAMTCPAPEERGPGTRCALAWRLGNLAVPPVLPCL